MFHVTARIRLLKTAEGGRTAFVRSGYRPSMRFGELYTDGALTFMDRQQAYPGDECEVRLTLVHPDYVRASLVVGARFSIMEGPRKVGEGTILFIPTALQPQEGDARQEPQDLALAPGACLEAAAREAKAGYVSRQDVTPPLPTPRG